MNLENSRFPELLPDEEQIENFRKATGGNEKDKEDVDTRSKAQEVLDLVGQNVKRCFKDQHGEHFIVVLVNDHVECMLIDSNRFRSWARLLWRRVKGDLLNPEIITNTVNMLVAESEFSGDTVELHVRLCGDEREVWYDLTDSEYRAVRITPTGWSIANAPTLFRRFKHQQPQALPVREYDADVLDRFLTLTNVKNDDDRLLLKCYIIAMFWPGIERAVHLLHGEQGSAKSTLHYLIKRLVDPSSLKRLMFPHDPREFVQLLSHHHVAYFDQVSQIPGWLGDYMCAAATGTGFSKRKLYTDDDDVVYNYQRCVGLNGINLLAEAKSDLLDRSIITHLERIPRESRRKNTEIDAEFDALRPHLLGYIFDALSKALQLKQQGVKVNDLPRMADFAETSELISQAMGNPPGMFLAALYRNINVQTDEAIEANPVALAVRTFMDDKERWEGTYGELLDALNPVAAALKMGTSKNWPTAANALSRRLNEAATNLREIGIVIDRRTDARTNTRLVEMCKLPPGSPTPPESVKQGQLTLDSAGSDLETHT